MSTPTRILVVIVIAQFCGTSLWFAGNAALPQLIQNYQWNDGALGHLTSAVQLGFIVGTFLFAISGITDRFSPANVFFICCLAGALSNWVCLFDLSSFPLMLISRLGVGVALAGVYPVGMKIASDWKAEGLGHWLGALVGALVVGTALPHLFRTLPVLKNPSQLLSAVSIISIAGGLLMLMFVPDGPFRKVNVNFSFKKVQQAFQDPAFQKPALGYFGHMWELYAFWAFVPFIVTKFNQLNVGEPPIPSIATFIVIALGALSCWWGGWWSRIIGSKKIALYALLLSLLCCLFSPWMWLLPKILFIAYLIIWSLAVIADSPQFSALIAQHAESNVRGSALTIVTCIGFSITIASIQLLTYLSQAMPDTRFLFVVLAIGPLLGVISLLRTN